MNNTLKYIIDKENRTITCIAENCQRDLEYILLKSLASKNSVLQERIRNRILYSVNNYFSLPDTLQVTVRCKPEDMWNEEKGKIIARIKLRRKYHRLIKKVLLKEKNRIEQELHFILAEYHISSLYVEEYSKFFYQKIEK